MSERDDEERKNEIMRFRLLERETTDPLAVRLVHEIVTELEAALADPLSSPSRDPGKE